MTIDKLRPEPLVYEETVRSLIFYFSAIFYIFFFHVEFHTLEGKLLLSHTDILARLKMSETDNLRK